jgi:hypothetical protein
MDGIAQAEDASASDYHVRLAGKGHLVVGVEQLRVGELGVLALKLSEVSKRSDHCETIDRKFMEDLKEFMERGIISSLWMDLIVALAYSIIAWMNSRTFRRRLKN